MLVRRYSKAIASSIVALAALCTTSLHAQADEDRAALFKAHAGGVLRLAAPSGAGSIDPQVNYDTEFWDLFFFTYDSLVALPKVTGPSGSQVVADLAEAVPTPTDYGKTYVFNLRRGVKFSDGRDVTPADVRASLQRIFKVANPNAGSWYNVIVGADACLQTPATCTLDGGVEIDPAKYTVTLHLTHADPEFMYKLATPFGAVLPADVQPKDMGIVAPPTTGPYIITNYDPARGLKLIRNPFFKEWSGLAQPQGYPDEIDYKFGLTDEEIVTQVENGVVDYMYGPKPLDRLPELSQKYAKYVRIHPMLGYYYAPMNTNIPPFDNPLARQAVAYALDRRVLVNLYGGPSLGSPLCQDLPAGLPGYEPYCPYTKTPGQTYAGPALEKAKDLVKQSGTAGQSVTVISTDKAVEKNIGEYIRSTLQSLGYQASLRAVSADIQFNYTQNTNNKVQISESFWLPDYPLPSDYLQVMLSCGSFHPGSDNSINMAGFCDPKIDDEMNAAIALQLTDTNAANKSWAKIDRELTDRAPLVTLFQMKNLVLLSPKVGNYVYSDMYQVVFSQLWLH